MTYCTGSSSRDLFNYWGEEGWGLQVPTERGGASAAQPAWRAGRGAEAQARPTAPALGGTICVGLGTAPAQEVGGGRGSAFLRHFRSCWLAASSKVLSLPGALPPRFAPNTRCVFLSGPLIGSSIQNNPQSLKDSRIGLIQRQDTYKALTIVLES